MVARTQQPEHGVDRGHSRSKDVGRLAAFQTGHAALQRTPIGVGRARVVVAFIFAQRILHVRGGLKYGRDDSARRRFRLLADVDRVGGESHEIPP